MSKAPTKAALERLYRKYNQRAHVAPDPLQFLYAFDDPRDREVAAMVAASLAYGRVEQIIKSVGAVLEVLGPHLCRTLLSASPESLAESFCGFVYRFATGDKLCALLAGVGRTIERRGSLEASFCAHRKGGGSLPAALHAMTEEIRQGAFADPGHLLAVPGRGSACKRLHLFLRWMVRKDDVDPGGWQTVSPSELIVPLDTHMHRAGRLFGFTERTSGDLKTAVEITEGFRGICPQDPVRYDFALTRVGMGGDRTFSELFK